MEFFMNSPPEDLDDDLHNFFPEELYNTPESGRATPTCHPVPVPDLQTDYGTLTPPDSQYSQYFPEAKPDASNASFRPFSRFSSRDDFDIGTIDSQYQPVLIPHEESSSFEFTTLDKFPNRGDINTGGTIFPQYQQSPYVQPAVLQYPVQQPPPTIHTPLSTAQLAEFDNYESNSPSFVWSVDGPQYRLIGRDSGVNGGLLYNSHGPPTLAPSIYPRELRADGVRQTTKALQRVQGSRISKRGISKPRYPLDAVCESGRHRCYYIECIGKNGFKRQEHLKRHIDR
ncbi:hypothetical protein F4859DRAFT_528654 [Xylaria cf. heliscus]|nr:hypothetical protein F4859DRAFT_528654 [Xylaria cf. heliscus]